MIKQISLITLLLFSAGILFGQSSNCNCIEELDELSEKVKKAKSYKKALKKNQAQSLLKMWNRQIKHEIEQDSLIDYFCAAYLQKYLTFFNDKHNQLYTSPKDTPKAFPVFQIPENFEALLHQDSISGTYYAGREKLALIKANDTSWVGLIIQSNTAPWEKGMLRLKINKLGNDKFELFEFYNNGILFYQKDITIKNGRIQSTYWNKQNQYFFHKRYDSTFNYKEINASFDYIGIKTLKRTNPLIAQGEKFYDNTLSRLQKPNLIIDLRNNGGGATKQIKPLLKAISREKNIKKIYILINFKTGSAAELATLTLLKDERVIVAGEHSSGMIAYGYGNKSYSGQTSCLNYQFSFSTKQHKKDLVQYEYIGLKPDIFLNNQSDWIDQILSYQ